MKKVFKLMAFATFCIALCTACEKEEPMSLSQTITVTEQTEMDALLDEAYRTAQSNSFAIITIATQQVDIYISRCMKLFGGSLSVATTLRSTDGTSVITFISNSSALAKKIWQNIYDTKAVHHTAKSEAEILQWKEDMKKEGYYQVVIARDENGIYHGVAYTREEWDKLQ